MAARRDGRRSRTAGVVLVRQRPGNGKAIFLTLEDETGIANIVLWDREFERFRKEVMGGRLLLIEGKVQKSPEGVIHLMAERVIDRTDALQRLSDGTLSDGTPPGPAIPATSASCRGRGTSIEA